MLNKETIMKDLEYLNLRCILNQEIKIIGGNTI